MFRTKTQLETVRLVILIYFLAVGALFVFTIPVGQAPDEPAHLAYINFVAVRNQLPNQYQPDRFIDYEGNQPPLYYLAGALLLKVINGGEPCRLEGQHSTYGWTRLSPRIPQGWEHWNIRFVGFRDRMAFYLLRLFSVGIGAGIVVLTFKIARLFFGDSLLQVVPALFMVTLPQFLFNCAYVNNDVLNNLFTTAALFYGLKMVTETEITTDAIALGVATGLSLCTKKTGLFLCPGIFALICWLTLRRKARFTYWIKLALSTFGVAALVSSWVLLRNRLLYGEWLGSQMERRVFPWMIQEKTLLSPYFRGLFPRLLYTSFIGRFGWMDVLLPRYTYLLYFLLMGGGGVGLGLNLWKERSCGSQVLYRERLMVYGSLGCILFCFAGILHFNLTYSQPQGRYLFSVLSLIGVLLTMGWKTLAQKIKSLRTLTPQRRRTLALGGTVLLIIMDFVSLWTIHAGL